MKLRRTGFFFLVGDTFSSKWSSPKTAFAPTLISTPAPCGMNFADSGIWSALSSGLLKLASLLSLASASFRRLLPLADAVTCYLQIRAPFLPPVGRFTIGSLDVNCLFSKGWLSFYTNLFLCEPDILLSVPLARSYEAPRGDVES